MTINPIETTYAGCRFRSRLEARWAVFFNRLGISWEYEPQGYNVNGRAYLPDFRITSFGLSISVEVKGENDRLDMRLLADFLEKESHTDMVLVLGPIPADTPFTLTHLMLYKPLNYLHNVTAPSELERDRTVARHLAELPEQAQEEVWDLVNERDRSPVSATLAGFFHQGEAFVGPISYFPFLAEGAFDPLSPPDMPVISLPKVRDAYTAARSARFEHGEQG